MAVKMLRGAALLALLMAGSAEAESIAEIGGPANPPPKSFTGQQFVDSRGCLFLRAGVGGNVNWVARVDRNHKPICGMTASGGAAVLAAPQPVAVGMASPVPEAMPAATRPTLPKPPKGWILAWKDDRLNPLRGVGTAEGQAAQDRLWTRTVPMVQVVSHPQATPRKTGLRISVSTMSAPATHSPALHGAAGLVQVGAFADPANAARVIARLTAAGLPVSSSPLKGKGKTLQVVYAGPFPVPEAGLRAVRGAGFPDAILR